MLVFWILLLHLVTLPAEESVKKEIPVSIKIQMVGASDTVSIVKDSEGKLKYKVTQDDGDITYLTPEEFTKKVYKEKSTRDWLKRLFNVPTATGVIWVMIGFLGQVFFTGRMILQWIVSEKAKKSIVPRAFWIMSLLGSAMLLSYAVYRRDPVFILGQSFGSIVYIRNLILYARAKEIDHTKAQSHKEKGQNSKI